MSRGAWGLQVTELQRVGQLKVTAAEEGDCKNEITESSIQQMCWFRLKNKAIGLRMQELSYFWKNTPVLMLPRGCLMPI